jgi:putative ABC transport system permease protein
LRQQGIEPVSRIADIEPVRALNHGLGVILLLVAGFAAAGMAVAIAATQWNAVQRKRRELALLALIGYGRCFLISMALLEGVLLGIAGVAAALALFAAAAVAIDHSFVHIQHLAGPACQLGPREIAAGTVATLALTLAASALAGWQIARIAPAEVLRET